MRGSFSMIIKDRAALLSHGNTAGRQTVLDIIEAGLAAPDPYENTKKVVRLEKGKLILGHPDFSQPPGQEPIVYDLKDVKNIYVVGGGKAAQKMAKGLEDALGDLITGGQVNAKKGEQVILKRINVALAGHPIPDEDSVAGAARMLEIEKSARGGDIVFWLNSGGGSALKALPAPGITLQDLQEVYRILYFGCGASMPEANAVRNLLTVVRMKHPKYVRGATLVQLLTNELPRRLRVHMSEFPYQDEYENAKYVLKKYRIWQRVPALVRTFLNKADPAYLRPTPEELKQRPYYIYQVMGPEYLIDAAKAKAEELGLNTTVLATSLNDVEAQPAGAILATIAQESEVLGRPLEPPCVFLVGGEVVVPIGQETGLGGRNQELVLAAAPRIAGSRNIVIASVDSDGTDGPTNVAGGIVDGDSMERIRQLGFDLGEELKRHNSSPVLEKLGDSIVTGNTGNNVRDLRVIYVGRSSF